MKTTVRTNAAQVLKENYKAVEQQFSFAEWYIQTLQNEVEFWAWLFEDENLENYEDLTEEHWLTYIEFGKELFGNSKELAIDKVNIEENLASDDANGFFTGLIELDKAVTANINAGAPYSLVEVCSAFGLTKYADDEAARYFFV